MRAYAFDIACFTVVPELQVDFGRPLHCLALVGGELHDLEKEMMDEPDSAPRPVPKYS
jgi:diphthamide biosynthesis methyltransferase